MLAAQNTVHSTLPAGLLQRGGDYNHGRGIGWPLTGNFHYQEVHSSWTGKGVKLLVGVGFRRAWGRPTANGAVARTADIEFIVGYGNRYAFSANNFIGNYKSAPTTVHPKRSVSLPSWVLAPKQAPAPFDVNIPFTGLIIYNGKDDLVWEIKVSKLSVAGGGYCSDRQLGNDYLVDLGKPIGTGCIPTGQTSTHTLLSSLYNYGPQMQLYANSRLGPANSAVTLVLGTKNTTTKIPGWCAPVHLAPLVYIPVGMPHSPTHFARAMINVNYTPSAVGVSLYAQAFAKDKNPGGISLSNACKMVMPPPPIFQTWKYVIAENPNSNVLSGPYTYGSLITGWR